MDCATVSIEIDDTCASLSQKTPIARKQHKCHECYRQILPGEQYERLVSVYDGMISTHKTCIDCLSIREVFFSGGYYFERIHEDLREHVFECYGDISESQITKLTPGARLIVAGILDEFYANADYGEE